MPDGEHCRRGCDARDPHLRAHRSALVVVVALCVAATPVVASAATVPSAPRQAIADQTRPHTQEVGEAVVIDGTQTSGPSGYLPPNAVIPWGLDRIDQRTTQGDGRYEWSTDGTGVDMYVVDSGLNANHLDFAGRVRAGWSYRTDPAVMSGILASEPVGSPDRCENSNGFDPADHPYDVNTFDYPSPLPTALQDPGWPDNQGHGTHVAGIAAGALTGVAKGVTLVPVRVMNSCGDGSTNALVAGLEWILEDHQAGQPAVVNMSVGYTTTVPQVEAVINDLLDEQVTIVAAAGNEGESSCGHTPAGTLGTISVGASDHTDGEASFSNFGLCVDMFSPGRTIVSTWITGPAAYASMSGTSMAAPHVAGAAALFLQGRPAATNDDVADWIFDRATACGISYHSPSSRTGLVMTPNLLLNVHGPAGTACGPHGISTTLGDQSVTLSWSAPTADGGSDVTGYVVSSSPSSAGCITVATTCTVRGLVPGTAYVFSVVARNAAGDGAPASVDVLAARAPALPVGLRAAPRNKSVRVAWSAKAASATYVVTASPGGRSCITTVTACTVTGLTNGKQYTFRIAVTGTNGITGSATKSVTGRPGFRVIATTVPRGSRTSLTRIVRSISRGSVRWTASGRCRVTGSALVASRQKGTCIVTMKVARAGTYPAMSTRVTVRIV